MKKETNSILEPLLNNTFVRVMLASKIPSNGTFVLITSDMLSDLTLKGVTQEFFLPEMKDILCIWPSSSGSSQVSLHIDNVLIVRCGTLMTFRIDKYYALSEFNLLAEDLFLKFETESYERVKL